MQTGSVQFCHFATQSYIYHTQYMPMTYRQFEMMEPEYRISERDILWQDWKCWAPWCGTQILKSIHSVLTNFHGTCVNLISFTKPWENYSLPLRRFSWNSYVLTAL